MVLRKIIKVETTPIQHDWEEPLYKIYYEGEKYPAYLTKECWEIEQLKRKLIEAGADEKDLEELIQKSSEHGAHEFEQNMNDG